MISIVQLLMLSQTFGYPFGFQNCQSKPFCKNQTSFEEDTLPFVWSFFLLFGSYSYCGHSFHIVSLLYSRQVYFSVNIKKLCLRLENNCTEPPLETELFVWRLFRIFLFIGRVGGYGVSGKHMLVVDHQVSFEKLLKFGRKTAQSKHKNGNHEF